MNHLDKVYTEIYKVERTVAFSVVFLRSSKVAAVVLCLHHSVRNLQRTQNRAGRIMKKIITCNLWKIIATGAV